MASACKSNRDLARLLAEQDQHHRDLVEAQKQLDDFEKASVSWDTCKWFNNDADFLFCSELLSAYQKQQLVQRAVRSFVLVCLKRIVEWFKDMLDRLNRLTLTRSLTKDEKVDKLMFLVRKENRLEDKLTLNASSFARESQDVLFRLCSGNVQNCTDEQIKEAVGVISSKWPMEDLFFTEGDGEVSREEWVNSKHQMLEDDLIQNSEVLIGFQGDVKKHADNVEDLSNQLADMRR